MEKKYNCYFCGDYVNTDVISPGRFEPYKGRDHLAKIALIDYESNIPFIEAGKTSSKYGVIIAGKEFGCGSSRDTAPLALSYAGVKFIIAKSFARIFFRNCINMGLIYPIQYDHTFADDVTGEQIYVDINKHSFHFRGNEFLFSDLGEVEQIMKAGGIISYSKLRGSKNE